ncbi:hypothetical protein FEM48_Zijuj04G0087400 [Ziziphus jujuba var. spinosa]|uniref:APO domain-containing protein n=1 Tax=Ziziphus jujuba var. spinosa TaxID=714518 RepID=A0A978VIW8_ZIZJJ|nr:hypothetical protein FEM48_Zijuj04G0087400 [Ziziphus jujuba var. spinosa]
MDSLLDFRYVNMSSSSEVRKIGESMKSKGSKKRSGKEVKKIGESLKPRMDDQNTGVRFCSEVYVGKEGHSIQTCCGYRRNAKNWVHEWIVGGLSDILVPVKTFHLECVHQDVIKHHQIFDFERVPAVVELCWQAGAVPSDEDLYPSTHNIQVSCAVVDEVESLSPDGLRSIANGTLRAWETLGIGIQKLLLVYPAKVCKHCAEVHVGPLGHKARLCWVF